ncbi:uncharacterized protein LOC110984974 isoform X4 [Acanthaster planci]|uniref:Uncharacterized protein LOC110984974 isoform X4 n=1 Tax=Acanthaster planci TaxID=133434 RepID=A0A8B7Z6R8_ACAPL|nr:uncharacterized protein LOC110984974 isoform X4 [Acanthaster planci]
MSSRAKTYGIKKVAQQPNNERPNSVASSSNGHGNGSNEVDSVVSPASSKDNYSPILSEEQKHEFGGCIFPFDAIALEGGGNKGLSATGAIRVLEELGYWENIKRFAGASAGSMVAALVAVGCNSHEIETFLRGDIQKVFLGVFCPVKVRKGKTNDYFVDGGLLCNYPIHCYDGWFLSMEKGDSFLRRFKSIEELPKLWEPKERFGERNDKTFGILLYAGNEREVMKQELMDRFDKFIKPSEKQEYPPTKLAKKRAELMKEQVIKAKEHRLLVTAFFNLMNVLEENDIDQSGTINEQEFEKAMNQTSSDFTEEDKKRLFGDDFRDTKALFKRMDIHADGEITFRELVSFAEKQGLEIMENFRGYKRQEITDLQSYFGAIMECLLLNMKRIFVQSSDVSRTIGIDTGYLDTLDFNMQKKDQDYLVQQGKLGCMAFLRELISTGKMTHKT